MVNQLVSETGSNCVYVLQAWFRSCANALAGEQACSTVTVSEAVKDGSDGAPGLPEAEPVAQQGKRSCLAMHFLRLWYVFPSFVVRDATASRVCLLAFAYMKYARAEGTRWPGHTNEYEHASRYCVYTLVLVCVQGEARAT